MEYILLKALVWRRARRRTRGPKTRKREVSKLQTKKRSNETKKPSKQTSNNTAKEERERNRFESFVFIIIIYYFVVRNEPRRKKGSMPIKIEEKDQEQIEKFIEKLNKEGTGGEN